jgi:hypothetical protein
MEAFMPSFKRPDHLVSRGLIFVSPNYVVYAVSAK